jgi:NAD(P)-dependent dehydrogenase (short-subunit alcohol dehydrogenase family)
VALVTGGSRGLGLTIAQELQNRGFDLMLAARSAEELEAAQTKLDGGTRVEYVAGDLTESAVVDELAEDCASDFGRLDLLVNNAGIFVGGPLAEFEESEWDKILGVNLKAPYLVTRALLPLLKKSQGQIVFINSIGGKIGLKNLCGYSASKFGLRGFADALRLELKDDGIRVTSIYPHGMNTGFEDIPADDPQRFKMMEPTDTARMVGEIADSPIHLQIPEIVLLPRSTEVGKRERVKSLLED